MKINEFMNNTHHKKEKSIQKQGIAYNDLSDLEKDIYILINYIRINPLDFSNNLRNKNIYLNNKEQNEIIKYLEEIYNKEKLKPFEEIPEISEAARNLLINISLNDKKYHNINLKELNPETLNLRTRLSNYGHRTGRIFETVIFKTNNPEDIVNNILVDEKGRNMLLSNKMKFIGIACDILPSNIICSVIDIVQDFIPYKTKEDINKDFNINNNIYDNNIDYPESHYKEESLISYNNLNYDKNINNLKLKLGFNKSQIENNNPNMNIIINNNDKYIHNLLINKYSNQINQRKNDIYNENNGNYKTPKKLSSIEILSEKKSFSPKFVNSYNIIINNKKVPIKSKVNNINQIKNEEDNNKNENNNIFTMAGRTSKEQQLIIDNSSKMNINKSKSVSSIEFNKDNLKKNSKNKFQRLNQKEKLEILHKINQRNKNQKSLSINNKYFYNAKSVNSNITNFPNNYIKKKSHNLEINIDEQNKINNYYNSDNQYNNIENIPQSNRFNTCLSNINDSNIVNYLNNNGSSPLYSTYIDTKYNNDLENKGEYSKNKLNEIKNDLLLFKNKIKEELKNEVKNEIKEEMKYEFNLNQKKKPNSIKTDEDYSDIFNVRNNNEDIYGNFNSQNEKNENGKKLLDEIYCKKKGNYFIKNKAKNRCCSEEKIAFINNNNKSKSNINSPKNVIKSFEAQSFIKKDEDKGGLLKNEYKDRYEQLNNPKTNEYNNFREYKNIYSRKKTNSYDFNNKSYFNEERKIKNRNQIKQLIRLYNIAKDSKRNFNKYNDDIIYDVINNNKSISNHFFKQNNINGENDINNNLNNLNSPNKSLYEQNKEIKNEKNNLVNKKIVQRKYEKVKPIGNFYKSINNKKYIIGNNIKTLNEEKNLINENKEKNKEEENLGNKNEKKEKNEWNNNTINEKHLSIEKTNNNIYKKINNLNDNVNIINSYDDKNQIYNDLKNERKNKSFFSNSAKLKDNEINSFLKSKEKLDNNNRTIIYNMQNKQQIKNNDCNNLKDNEKLYKEKDNKIKNYFKTNNCLIKSCNNTIEKQENENLKTPIQIQKQSSRYEINNNDKNYKDNHIFNTSLKSTTYRKQKKFIIPHNFPIKSKNI